MHREECKMRQNILRNVSILTTMPVLTPIPCLLYSLWQHKDDDRQLVQLLSLSDLLAVTCEGESKYADDVCQGIFEIDELIR